MKITKNGGGFRSEIPISHIITKKLQETHWIKHDIFKQKDRNSIFFVKHTPVILVLFTT